MSTRTDKKRIDRCFVIRYFESAETSRATCIEQGFTLEKIPMDDGPPGKQRWNSFSQHHEALLRIHCFFFVSYFDRLLFVFVEQDSMNAGSFTFRRIILRHVRIHVLEQITQRPRAK